MQIQLEGVLKIWHKMAQDKSSEKLSHAQAEFGISNGLTYTIKLSPAFDQELRSMLQFCFPPGAIGLMVSAASETESLKSTWGWMPRSSRAWSVVEGVKVVELVVSASKTCKVVAILINHGLTCSHGDFCSVGRCPSKHSSGCTLEVIPCLHQDKDTRD